MKRFSCRILVLASVLAAVALLARTTPPGHAEDAPPVEKVNPADCFECHAEVETLWQSGVHKETLNCVDCHEGLKAHMDEPDANDAVVRFDPATCGACHENQFKTYFTVNLKKPARLEKSQLTGRSPNPFWDKLMAGHGFTKEHNAPRSHASMLVDHLVVDRAYGGRFQPKESIGWKYPTLKGPISTWEVLDDTHPETNEHKAFLPESGPAANTTCLQCKSTDAILKWKFMGDKDPAAKWDRTSNVVDYVKDLKNIAGCIHCHDPHAAKPRIVRDGLIQALTREAADTLWHKDPKRTKVDVVTFRDFRKIGILEKSDTRLQCGQCHVEYNCNPGYDTTTGEKVPFTDQRTNHFPYKDVFQIYDHYNALAFRDFKHAATGGLLFKAQHPEAEVFYNSKHDQNGVRCNDCHMPRMMTPEGKEYTSHWQTSPRNYIEMACLKCHKEWTRDEAVYSIDAVQNHVRGKMRKAEFWLSGLIDKIVEGKKLGLDEAVIKEAQEQHQRAHILWEWWTAENSDGFHNPDQARESLTRSVEESKKGIDLIVKAIAERQGK